MKARQGFLIIEPIKEEVKTSSGFIHSGNDANNMKASKAKVISFGDKVEGINEGDIVLYAKGRSFPIVIDGETRTMITDNDLLVVL